LVAVAMVSMALFDLLEILLFRSEIDVWGGTVRAFTLWPGKTYQFPLYEPILVGILYGSFAALRYFRDDRGNSIAERGADDVNAAGGTKAAMRLFALIGCSATLYGVLYMLPMQWFALHVDSSPHLPSYLMNGVCGPETPGREPDAITAKAEPSYPCPDKGTPVYRSGSTPGRDSATP
jgi:hypothetical protein